MRRLVRRLIPGTPQDQIPDVSYATVGLDRRSIEAYLADWLRRAGQNPEGVGYADFSADGKRCGVEIYSAPAHYYGSIGIERGATMDELADIRRRLQPIVPTDRIDDIAVGWSIRFDDTDSFDEERFVDALLVTLRDVCGVTAGTSLDVLETWT